MYTYPQVTSYNEHAIIHKGHLPLNLVEGSLDFEDLLGLDYVMQE
jgi:hypothetical protein